MGCDIYLYTEYLKDGKWQPCETWKPDTRWGDGEELTVPYHQRPYHDRNYNFFAWLANVRNNTWGEQIAPICEPKGLPEDCCEEIKKASERWNGDGHSHSWFLYSELEEAWKKSQDQKVNFNACVDTDNPSPELQAWLNTPEDIRSSPPGGYAAGIYKQGRSIPPVKWTEPLRECIKHAYEKLSDYLWEASFEFKVKHNEIRIVFWFDN